MTRTSVLRLAFVFSAVLLLAIVIAPRKAVLHAQSGCDATTFNGAYGSNLSGSVYDNQGYQYFLASVGRFLMDGAGNISGSDTSSFDGTIARHTYTGTYTVNADCTGSMVLQTAGGGTLHGDFSAVNNAKEIHFVQTDTNYIFSGIFTRQNQ